MNELIVKEQKEKITSLELVEQINIFREQEGNRKELRHDTLRGIIKDEFEEEILSQNILEKVVDSNGGRPSKVFELTLSQAKQILMRENKFVRKAMIHYIEELEKQLQNQFKVPTTFKEALQLALEQQEKIEALELDNKVKGQQLIELQPKGTYYDLVLKSPNLITTTVIAKDYGKSAQWLNQKLHELGIQYKQSGIWLLYQQYADKGYTKTETVVVNKETNEVRVHTKWTQSGRLFIYDKLKEMDILPLIEK